MQSIYHHEVKPSNVTINSPADIEPIIRENALSTVDMINTSIHMNRLKVKKGSNFNRNDGTLTPI